MSHRARVLKKINFFQLASRVPFWHDWGISRGVPQLDPQFQTYLFPGAVRYAGGKNARGTPVRLDRNTARRPPPGGERRFVTGQPTSVDHRLPPANLQPPSGDRPPPSGTHNAAQGCVRRGGRGSATQRFVYQKWPDQIFPIVNFVFSDDGHFGRGRGGGGPGGVTQGGLPPPLLLRCTAILTLP